MAAIKTVLQGPWASVVEGLPVENAARFSTLRITMNLPVNTAASGWRPVPVSEAECRCRGGGCEAGRRARREGQEAPSCRAPGAAPERGKRSEAE